MQKLFEDLDKLRTRLIRMGSLVEEQVEFALRALLERNRPLAEIVVERDDKVDKFDIKIDKQCQKIFALRQPVASDLRLLLSALKINNELERIGDIAQNIARISISLNDTNILERINLAHLTAAAHSMIKDCLDSYVNNDPAISRQILSFDSKIDEMTTEIIAVVVNTMKSSPDLIEDGVQLVILLRYIERMCDHATNIAENVIFLVDADLVAHQFDDHAIDTEETL